MRRRNHRQAASAPGPHLPPRLAALAALALLAGCRGSDPQPLEPIALDRFGDQASLVAGGGRAATFGHTSMAGLRPTLRLSRFDALDPDRTVFLGDIAFGGGGAFTRLAVTDEAAAVVVSGVAYVVDLTSQAQPVVAWPSLGDVHDVAVGGRWVLAAAGDELLLGDRDTVQVVATFAAASRPTALLATARGFLAFTEAGYVVVEASVQVPGFTEVADPVLRNVRSAYPDGAGAIVAGPATAVGQSRVLRLDLADPALPVVVRGHEVPGTYAAFAWDGGATSVIAVHGAGDGAEQLAFHEGFVVREGASGFTATGLPLSTFARSSLPLAAHADRLLAVSAQGLHLLRIR